MDRRKFVKGTAAVAGAVTFPHVTFGQAAPAKIGVVGPKTGPLAGGAAVTHFPNFKLWAKEVNDKGGLKLERRAAQGRADRIRRSDQARRKRSRRSSASPRSTRPTSSWRRTAPASISPPRRSSTSTSIRTSPGGGDRQDGRADQANTRHVLRPGHDDHVRDVGGRGPQEAGGRKEDRQQGRDRERRRHLRHRDGERRQGSSRRPASTSCTTSPIRSPRRTSRR